MSRCGGLVKGCFGISAMLTQEGPSGWMSMLSWIGAEGLVYCSTLCVVRRMICTGGSGDFHLGMLVLLYQDFLTWYFDLLIRLVFVQQNRVCDCLAHHWKRIRGLTWGTTSYWSARDWLNSRVRISPGAGLEISKTTPNHMPPSTHSATSMRHFGTKPLIEPQFEA